jgi:ABC-type microcin C transport system permease subunit YejB
VASLLVRRFRARDVERLQIRWFAYAFAVGALGVILKYVVSEPLGLVWLGRAGYALDLIGTAGIPISMGIAITRYRLYEIDILINRTLVYGALTATLALVYIGCVTATQAIFQTFTGHEQLPQLTVVASTLAIAALFTPLRGGIQSFIDRRFYRKKYDARQTLETFSAKLRDETDLEALNKELVEVVRETMQPEHVSLWLRPDTGSTGRQPV